MSPPNWAINEYYLQIKEVEEAFRALTQSEQVDGLEILSGLVRDLKDADGFSKINRNRCIIVEEVPTKEISLDASIRAERRRRRINSAATHKDDGKVLTRCDERDKITPMIMERTICLALGPFQPCTYLF